MSSSSRQIVVVLGMHRAGTSLLMSVLSRMGLAVGDDLLEGDEANAEGYWELREIYTLQDRVLEQVGRPWDVPAGVLPLPSNWLKDAGVQSLRPALADVLRRRLLTNPGPVGFKDPRTALLLPLWEQVFADLGLQPVYVLATRDPGAVAQSLRRRGLPLAHGFLLWARTYSEALVHATDRCAAIVDYDDWFCDAPGTGDRLCRALAGAGIELPGGQNVAVERVKPSLRHWRGEDAVEAPDFVGRLYALLRQASGHAAGLRRMASHWDPAELEDYARDWQRGCWQGQRFLVNALDQAQKQVSGHGRIELTYIDEGKQRERCIFMHPPARLSMPLQWVGGAELRMGLGLQPQMRGDPRAGTTRVRVLVDGRDFGEATLSYRESSPAQPWKEQTFLLPHGNGRERVLTLQAEPVEASEDFHWFVLWEPVVVERGADASTHVAPLAEVAEPEHGSMNAGLAGASPPTAQPSGDKCLRETLDLDHIVVPPVELLEFVPADKAEEDAPSVVAIVDAREGSRFLRTLLPTLRSQRGLQSISIIVVHQGPDDEVESMAGRYGAAAVRPEPQSGMLNMAEIAQGRADYIVVIPDDALPTSKDWLRAMTDGLRRHGVCAASCRELPRQGAGLYGSLRCHSLNEGLFGPAEGDRVLGSAAEQGVGEGLGPGHDRVWVVARQILTQCRASTRNGLACALVAELPKEASVAVLATPAVARSVAGTPYEILTRHAGAASPCVRQLGPEIKPALAYMRALKACLRSADDVSTPHELERAVERALDVYIPATSNAEELEGIDDTRMRELLMRAGPPEHDIPGGGSKQLAEQIKERLVEISARMARIYPHVDDHLLDEFRACAQNVFAEILGQYIESHHAHPLDRADAGAEQLIGHVPERARG